MVKAKPLKNFIMLKLLLRSFRIYSIPYAVIVCLTGLFLTVPSPDYYTIVIFMVASTFCWIGGMLYYDVTHAWEDKIKKPYRLIPLFPHLTKKIILLSSTLIFAASLLIFIIDLLKGAILLGLGLTLMFLYNIFKKMVFLYAKYVVRGFAGVFLVLFAPFVFSTINLKLALVGATVFLLDLAGNLAGDIRDWEKDAVFYNLKHWNLKKAKSIHLLLSSLGVISLFVTAVFSWSNPNLAPVILLFLLLSYTIFRVKTNIIHRIFTLFKTALLTFFLAIYISSYLLMAVGFLLLPIVNYAYKFSHPEF